MPVQAYTRDDVRRAFAYQIYDRANAYLHRVKHLTVTVEDGAVRAEAQVQGSARRPYETGVLWDGRDFHSRCTCPYGYACKHAAAVAIVGLEPVAQAIAGQGPSWKAAIDAFRHAPAPSASATSKPFVFRLMAVRPKERPEPALLLAVGSGRGEAFKAGSLYGVHSRQGVSPLDRLIAKGLEGCFNAGDTPLFLISLKAGGTGLNQTGAAGVLLKEGERRGTRYRSGRGWRDWLESPSVTLVKGHSTF